MKHIFLAQRMSLLGFNFIFRVDISAMFVSEINTYMYRQIHSTNRAIMTNSFPWPFPKEHDNYPVIIYQILIYGISAE